MTAENGYQATGYENDSRQLLRMLDTAGVLQDDVLLVYDPRADTGEMYRLLPECS